MDIRQQLLAAFEAEHREHLDAIRGALAGGADAADWNDVFRRAHSLKGASRAVDLPAIEALAHRLETLFERVRAGRLDLDERTRGATHLALDRIEGFVADMKAGTARMPEDALSALDACLSDEAPSPDAMPVPPIPPRSAAPPADPFPPASVPEAPSEAPVEAGPSVVRVPAAAVAAMSRAAHELAGALSGQEGIAAGLAGIASAATDLRRRADGLVDRGLGSRREGVATDEAMRAELAALASGLSALMRMAADVARDHGTAFNTLDAASARVRDEAERLALVPAETAFGGFARTLRETARSEGLSIEVTVRGLEMPVDRAMLQALRDPVLHALRNALSHGAEAETERVRSGRPAALGIDFEVAARGGALTIAVRDDGRGPNLGAIESRARERGLLAPGETATAERLLGFVFEQGFSTAAAVDALAGRGVGLSVVAEAVRDLHGSVRLEARAPHGAALVMTVPLSAARRAVLVVEAGGATYALPADAAERLLRLDLGACATVAGRPVARIGDAGAEATLPVVDLAAVLGASSPAGAVVPAVVLRAGTRRCALTVDRLREVRTLLVLPAPPIGNDPGLVSGTVILDGGVPALVLDPDALLDRGRSAGMRPPLAPADGRAVPAGTMPETRRSTILVVDDSITTRTLEKSILEAAGYRVVVCVDGQDALDRLRAGIEPVDLVVADVEMPRLDGFGLVAALRAEEDFARLPVILMTSRGAEEDVARGLELGADAYLTKQTFDQGELLDTVRQLL